jgi:hypothetical protein
MRFIIGIGSGRTGTNSLAKLFNNQKNTICFHELNPACMKWKGTEVTVNSMLREFEDLCAGKETNVSTDFTSPNRNTPLGKLAQMDSVDVVGDIGFYYLTYVPLLCSKKIDIRIPCIKRDKEETIRSYIKKVTVPYTDSKDIALPNFLKLFKKEPTPKLRNHWIEHDGSVFVKDTKWDKCFPKFNSNDLYEALDQYWEYYYETASELEYKYPNNVKIFSINELNSNEGQQNILQFCGFDEFNTGTFHTNKTSD